ncbi:basic salivary proline-rich protein 1-like [Dunckerocampus dactyliophorus]|uniref:basic salivary proline-rich protein 1-like n=1 Tax=Dunckerocampus dactyliophorus TaxID=161453 RepID=UPI00240608BC|nr:basic salivary proline-rich protein 1-like [Dunckerocampus dactyliophorus]
MNTARPSPTTTEPLAEGQPRPETGHQQARGQPIPEAGERSHPTRAEDHRGPHTSGPRVAPANRKGARPLYPQGAGPNPPQDTTCPTPDTGKPCPEGGIAFPPHGGPGAPTEQTLGTRGIAEWDPGVPDPQPKSRAAENTDREGARKNQQPHTPPLRQDDTSKADKGAGEGERQQMSKQVKEWTSSKATHHTAPADTRETANPQRGSAAPPSSGEAEHQSQEGKTSSRPAARPHQPPEARPHPRNTLEADSHQPGNRGDQPDISKQRGPPAPLV